MHAACLVIGRAGPAGRSRNAKARDLRPALPHSEKPLTAAILPAIPAPYAVVTQPCLVLVLVLAKLATRAPVRIRIVMTPIGVTILDCNPRCSDRYVGACWRNQRKTGRKCCK
jgi:hypothetical protein